MKWKNSSPLSATILQYPCGLNSPFLVGTARYSLQVSEPILGDKFHMRLSRISLRLNQLWFLIGTWKILAAYILSYADFVLRYLEVKLFSYESQSESTLLDFFS